MTRRRTYCAILCTEADGFCSYLEKVKLKDRRTLKRIMRSAMPSFAYPEDLPYDEEGHSWTHHLFECDIIRNVSGRLASRIPHKLTFNRLPGYS